MENAHLQSLRNSQFLTGGDGGRGIGVSSGGGGGRTSWRRRPIINCPSQLSFRSDGSGQSYNYNRYSNILSRWYLDRHHPLPPHLHHQPQGPQPRLYLNYPPLTEDLDSPTNLLRAVPATTFNDDLRINTISQSMAGTTTPYTPQSRISRVHASSPASSGAAAAGLGTSNPLLVNSPWSPLYFSDLSSVRQPSSADRSFPTPMSGLSLRYMQQDRELPALRTIHEETRRLAQGFMPLASGGYSDYPHSPLTSPRQYNHHGYSNQTMRPIRSRLFPRQSRLTRTVGDLSPTMFPVYPYNRNMVGDVGHVEISPASRSSSSGFGSKNTSTQPNQSSLSAGSHNHLHSIHQNQQQQLGNHSTDWRSLPPYKPPPTPPISTLHHQHNHFHPYSNVPFSTRFFEQQAVSGNDPRAATLTPNWRLLKRTSLNRSPSSPPPLSYNSPYNMDHWLDLMQRVSEMPNSSAVKAVDVGSVDGAYEFDPATPTPTASTPTGLPMLMVGPHTGDLGFDSSGIGLASPSTSSSLGHHFRKRPPTTRYENIEARVQAMKEEFYEYKKRQAMKRLTAPLESAC